MDEDEIASPAPEMDAGEVEETAEESIAAIRAGRQQEAADVLETAPSKVADDSEDGEDEEEADEAEPEDDAGEDEAEDSEHDADEDDSDDEKKPVTAKEAKAKLAKAEKLFAKGDVPGALKALFGEAANEGNLNADWRRFKALRGQQESFRTEKEQWKSQVDKERADFSAQVQKTVQQLRPAASVFQAMQSFSQSGDCDAFVDAFQKQTGVEFPTFLKSYVAGQKAPVNQQTSSEIAQLRAEIAALKNPQQAEQTPEQKRAEQEAQLTAYYQELEEELDGHPVTKVKGWEKKVLAELRRHPDKKLGGSTLTPERAAKRVVTRLRKQAEALGLKEAPKASTSRKAGSTGSVASTLSRSTGNRTGSETISDEESALESIRAIRAMRRGKK